MNYMKPNQEALLSMLQKSKVFRNVPREQLHWLVNKSQYVELKAGDFFFRKGDPIDRMLVLLKGTALYLQKQNDHFRTLDEITAGEVTGALPYSRATTAVADLKVQEDAEGLSLSSDHFKEMIMEQHELTEVLVHTMTSRVRELTRSQQQSEKMAALGKLSAGLAHELNNPASAVLRSSAELKKKLTTLPEPLAGLLKGHPLASALEYLQDLFHSKSEQDLPSLGLLEKNSIEEELADWLKDLGMEKPYEVAEILSQFQINTSELERLKENLDNDQLKSLLKWFTLLLSMGKLADEVKQSSKRISELVSAVKTYSHMDKSPEKEFTNILQGLKDTLTILNFKLRKKNIKVHTNFPSDLPKACVYAGELNQLWTNLLDNAIDAIEEGGEITVSVSTEEENLLVKIQDNGPGIPEEIRANIFDPFFTTKELSKGSGLGLEISKRIVEDHDGELHLFSEPGKTIFTVSLPL